MEEERSVPRFYGGFDSGLAKVGTVANRTLIPKLRLMPSINGMGVVVKTKEPHM